MVAHERTIIPPRDDVEHVVLTDEQGGAIGTTPKATVHSAATPTHRAFSSFIFNKEGYLILTQRASTKKTWPGIWTNTCCGHPMLEETPEQAARRRLAYELGMTVPHLQLVLPDFRYFVEREGTVENEFCPVLVGFTDADPAPNPAEVGAWCRVPWDAYVAIARALPGPPLWTPKSQEEYGSYRNLFASDAAYNHAHSIVLPGHGRVPLSEWSLWETRELLQNETFKDLMRTHMPHEKR